MSSASSLSSSVPSLATTPSAVLSLICQYVQVIDILRLLRCCSHLRRLHVSNASFSSEAWKAARLKVRIAGRLHEWALPYESCIVDPYTDMRRIPLLLWQQAVPVMQYSIAQWARDGSDQTTRALSAALAAELQTATVRSGRKDHVVLSQLTWSALDENVPWRSPCFRVQFILVVTPHLQHLELSIDQCTVTPTPLLAMTALVPRLRSLHIERHISADRGGYSILDFTHSETAIVPIHNMLTQLPHLTSLTCRDIHLKAQDLLDMVAHATLEHIHLYNRYAVYYGGRQGKRARIYFWTNGSELHLDSAVDECAVVDSGWEAAKKEWRDEADRYCAHLSIDQPHMHARQVRSEQWLSRALNRVTPSRRSIIARLQLAHYLQRELDEAYYMLAKHKWPPRVAGTEWDECVWPLLLYQHRQLVAMLRSTLYNQLAALAAPAPARVASRPPAAITASSGWGAGDESSWGF